jgi:hypothetical protein
MMFKKTLDLLANVLTFGAYARDKELALAKAKLSVIDKVFGLSIGEENGRTVVTFGKDTIFRFEGNAAFCAEKAVVIESGWKNSNNFHKIELNPEADVDTIFSGFETGNTISIDNFSKVSSINNQDQHGECACHLLSDSATSVPGTAVGDLVQTTKDPQT